MLHRKEPYRVGSTVSQAIAIITILKEVLVVEVVLRVPVSSTSSSIFKILDDVLPSCKGSIVVLEILVPVMQDMDSSS